MNRVGEVNRCRARRQAHDLALGCEDEDLVVEHVDLERVDIVVGLGVLLVFKKPSDPLKFLFRALADVLLVFPVCRDAVFRRLVHFPRADLPLKRNALRADDGRVERLVHVGLRGRDIVLKPARNGVKEVVDVA